MKDHNYGGFEAEGLRLMYKWYKFRFVFSCRNSKDCCKLQACVLKAGLPPLPFTFYLPSYQ